MPAGFPQCLGVVGRRVVESGFRGLRRELVQGYLAASAIAPLIVEYVLQLHSPMPARREPPV